MGVQTNSKAVPYNVLMPLKAKGIQQNSRSVKKHEEYKASYVDKNLLVSQIKLKEHRNSLSFSKTKLTNQSTLNLNESAQINNNLPRDEGFRDSSELRQNRSFAYKHYNEQNHTTSTSKTILQDPPPEETDPISIKLEDQLVTPYKHHQFPRNSYVRGGQLLIDSLGNPSRIRKSLALKSQTEQEIPPIM